MVNVYDNHLRANQAWPRNGSNTRRRTLTDANWDSIIEGKVVILWDFNPHSRELNLHCVKRMNTVGLETLIERHHLILINKLAVESRPTQNSRTSIIDLLFPISDIGALNACVINKELSTPSDNEVVVCHLKSLDEIVGGMETSQEVTG